ncbi:alcohol dehydrogenase catalytic domain-containing protein [Arthrobacter sp. SAFR-044]|uniref:alcohol dehydrogenase catalytic domain-containing protein n=1 Tax=Arthrobacter sp. SAFR-044 TaxID=3387278 RepID=UPI003F7C5339
MKAYRAFEAGRVELTDVTVPQPREGEVRIRTVAAGVCHSDLTLLSAPELFGAVLPVTLGHEMAGIIDAIGPGVRGWTVGQAVGVKGISGCGTCRRCREGRPASCATGWSALGVTDDGGMAEYFLARPEHLVDATGLDLRQAAPLTDAGLTAYGAVERARTMLTPGSVALVIGVGGLGHLAVQILKATTAAAVIAVDVSDQKLALAVQHGADLALTSGEETAEKILARFPEGVDATFDFVGRTSTLALGAAVTRAGGLLAITGISDGSLDVAGNRAGGVKPEVTVVKTSSGSKSHLVEVFALARDGYLTVDIEEYAFTDTERAFEDLRTGQIMGRAVLVFDNSRNDVERHSTSLAHKNRPPVGQHPIKGRVFNGSA